VTGAGGFLGKATVSLLRERSWEAIACSRGAGAQVSLDFDSADWPAALEKTAPCDAIVHLASRVDLRADADPALFSSTNIQAVQRLSAVAKAWRARLILASSVAVYGAAPRVDAATPPAPVNPYGRAKLEAEDALARAGVPWTVLRLAGIFGLNGPSHLGLNRAIMAALEGRSPSLQGAGRGRRNYAYVHDAAAAVAEVLERGIDGIHIVAGPETPTVEQMLEAVAEVFSPGSRVERGPGADSGDMLATPSAALTPGRTFRAALEDIRARSLRKTAC
jgi:UDP-glucose 4-epimerase